MIPARVGLSGGIGSGKSTVATLFQQLGVEVIDADQISRRLTRSGTHEFNLIVDYFGHEIVNPEGELDRQKLGQIVFSDSHKREHLQSILHPAIRAEMSSRVESARGAYVILEIPLLIETGQFREMDRVLIVTCPDKIKIQRLMATRNMTREKVENILKAQKTDPERIRYADDVISNDSTLEFLEKQVENLHRQYSKIFSQTL